VRTDAPVLAQQSGPPDPSDARSRQRWLIAVVAGWVVLLMVLAYLSVHRGAPTVREQRDIGRAAPVVDRAIGELVAAAGPDTVLELADPRYDTGCRVTVFRDGVNLDRKVTFRTAPADGPALLTRIADHLPRSYQAGTRSGRGDEGPTLRADAGEFVAITGGVTTPGVVELTASTGCRPPTPGFAGHVDLLFGMPIDDEPVRLLKALGASGVTPVDRVSVGCPGGGAAHTARATGQVAPAAPLAKAVPTPAGAVVVADEPELYAYRGGPLSVVVSRTDDKVRVAVSTGCPAP
jgi:hypothetical protein